MSKIKDYSKNRTYRIFYDMHRRCYKENRKDYKYYGARGIAVSERWHDFYLFYEDMGDPLPKMELDRIDKDGPYSKENCRWTTRQMNVYNRSPSVKSKLLPTGVSRWTGKKERYCARCRVDRRGYHIGIYDTVEEARIAYEKFCMEWWGFIAN